MTGVIMLRSLEQGLRLGVFANTAMLHHNHTVADMTNHRRIMADEQQGQVALLPQFFQ